MAKKGRKNIYRHRDMREYKGRVAKVVGRIAALIAPLGRDEQARALRAVALMFDVCVDDC